MDINGAFPSKYLKASDLAGQTVTVTISDIVVETVGQGEDQTDKPIVYFAGKEKGVVLNVTNSKAIAKAYGDETDEWVGKPIEVYPDTTPYKGDIVDCIRVRVPNSAPRATKGDIPF